MYYFVDLQEGKEADEGVGIDENGETGNNGDLPHSAKYKSRKMG